MLTGNPENAKFIHIKFKFLLIFFTCLMAGCSVIDVQGEAKFSPSKDWAILRFHNYSLAPRAGEKAEMILATLLRVKGITNIEMYQEENEDIDIWPDRDARSEFVKRLSKEGAVRGVESRFRLKSGEIRFMRWSTELFNYGEEQCVIALGRDITARKQAELDFEPHNALFEI